MPTERESEGKSDCLNNLVNKQTNHVLLKPNKHFWTQFSICKYVYINASSWDDYDIIDEYVNMTEVKFIITTNIFGCL